MSGINLKKYLLDTNSIIYAMNNSFVLPPCQYCFSIITEIELLSFSKLTKEDSDLIRLALLNFEVINLNDEVKELTIKIRKNSNIKLPDSIIIASALSEEAILVTSDKQLLNSGLVKSIELSDLSNDYQ